MESGLDILPTSTSCGRQLGRPRRIHVLRRVPGAHAAEADADEVPHDLTSDSLQADTSAVIQCTTTMHLSSTPKHRSPW